MGGRVQTERNSQAKLLKESKAVQRRRLTKRLSVSSTHTHPNTQTNTDVSVLAARCQNQIRLAKTGTTAAQHVEQEVWGEKGGEREAVCRLRIGGQSDLGPGLLLSLS